MGWVLERCKLFQTHYYCYFVQIIGCQIVIHFIFSIFLVINDSKLGTNCENNQSINIIENIYSIQSKLYELTVKSERLSLVTQ